MIAGYDDIEILKCFVLLSLIFHFAMCKKQILLEKDQSRLDVLVGGVLNRASQSTRLTRARTAAGA